MIKIEDQITSLIESYEEEIIQLSDRIWDIPETRFQEFESFKILSNFLEEKGFIVERGVGDIETALSLIHI